ncbi:MAG: glycosyltransferase family 4 protein [Gaiellaceae bacterium]
MRVLFNLLDAHVGGGQEVALGVAQALAEHGHSIGVVTPAPGAATERFEALGATTHTSSLVSLRRPGVVGGARLARAYDVVYSHTSVPGEILAGAAAALARRPHVVHRHVYPHFSPRARIRAAQRSLYRTILGRARIIAVAEHIADHLVALGTPRDHIEVITNGVKIPEHPAPARADGGPLRIGLLGRLDPQKGGDVFVESAAGVGDAAELVLGVPSANGRYAVTLLAAARAANVGVVMPAGPEFLRAVDVVALPSRYEGHPLTLLEAMALGKPVVASAIPGVREVIEPDAAGLLVPPGDAAALAAAFRALADDAGLRAELGERAREVAVRRYAVEPIRERIVEFLEAAVRRARS